MHSYSNKIIVLSKKALLNLKKNHIIKYLSLYLIVGIELHLSLKRKKSSSNYNIIMPINKRSNKKCNSKD